MDRAVLEGDPHSVIEGMLIGAYAIGAEKGYVYVRAEYPIAVHHMHHSVARLREIGLLGSNILGTGLNFDLEIKEGAGAFVCGEETAMIASIEASAARPGPAAVPGPERLVGQIDHDQQRRDAGQHPADLPEGWEWFAGAGHGEEQGYQGLRAGRQGQEHRAGRGADGRDAARNRL